MVFPRRKKISEFVIDETLIKVGPESVWLWVFMEPKNKEILALTVFKETNMPVAERFISCLVKAHGKHPVSTDGETWYPQTCRFLKIKHYIHSPFEKSLVERTIRV